MLIEDRPYWQTVLIFAAIGGIGWLYGVWRDQPLADGEVLAIIGFIIAIEIIGLLRQIRGELRAVMAAVKDATQRT